jgi:hypothetical protein
LLKQQTALNQWLSARFDNVLTVSPELKQLVSLCFCLDPAERIDVEQLFDCPYFYALHQESKQTSVPRWVKVPAAAHGDMEELDSLLDGVELTPSEMAQQEIVDVVDNALKNTDLLGVSAGTSSGSQSLSSSARSVSRGGLLVSFDDIESSRSLTSLNDGDISKPGSWMRNVSRAEAEESLRTCNRNAFLIRPSATVPGSFVLSAFIKNKSQILHKLISNNPQMGFYLEGNATGR